MKKFFLILIVILFLLLPLTTRAALIDADAESLKCIKTGDCGICGMLFIVSNLTKLILGLVGAFALLFFVIGGFMWITSAGSAEKVKKGQTLMANTIIGIIIVVLAWFAVNFIITSIAGKPQIISTDTAWYEVCKDEKK